MALGPWTTDNQLTITFGSGPLADARPFLDAALLTRLVKEEKAVLGRYMKVVPLSRTVPYPLAYVDCMQERGVQFRRHASTVLGRYMKEVGPWTYPLEKAGCMHDLNAQYLTLMQEGTAREAYSHALSKCGLQACSS